jgi:hypothetical protein
MLNFKAAKIIDFNLGGVVVGLFFGGAGFRNSMRRGAGRRP